MVDWRLDLAGGNIEEGGIERWEVGGAHTGDVARAVQRRIMDAIPPAEVPDQPSSLRGGST
jgi:hypothetical protein